MPFFGQEITRTFSSAHPLHGSAYPISWSLDKSGDERTGKELRHHWLHLLSLFFILVLTAVPTGVAGMFFRESVHWANFVRGAHPYLIYALPFCGIGIAFLYRVCRISHRNEFSQLHSSFHESTSPRESQIPVSPFLAPLVYSSSVLSHLFGASVGCEGASLIVGGGIGSQIARWFHLSGRDFSLIVLCAMASSFSPLLGTPFTAAVFVLERCGVRRPGFLFPCLLASFISFEMARYFGMAAMRFELELVPGFSAVSFGRVLALSAVCVLAGTFFRLLLQTITNLTDRFLPNRFLAMGFGGVVLVNLTLLSGTQDYCGTGLHQMTDAFFGSAVTWAFFWKILFTSLALGFGFKGGQIVPAFFVGMTLGCVLAPYFGFDSTFAASLGMIVLFTTVVRCPAASLLLALELFSGSAFFWFILAVLIGILPKYLAPAHCWKIFVKSEKQNQKRQSL